MKRRIVLSATCTSLLLLSASLAHAFLFDCMAVNVPVGKVPSTDQVVFELRTDTFSTCYVIPSLSEDKKIVGAIMPYAGPIVPLSSDVSEAAGQSEDISRVEGDEGVGAWFGRQVSGAVMGFFKAYWASDGRKWEAFKEGYNEGTGGTIIVR